MQFNITIKFERRNIRLIIEKIAQTETTESIK